MKACGLIKLHDLKKAYGLIKIYKSVRTRDLIKNYKIKNICEKNSYRCFLFKNF